MNPSKLGTGKRLIWKAFIARSYFFLSMSYVIDSLKGLNSKDFENLRSQEKGRGIFENRGARLGISLNQQNFMQMSTKN